MGLLYRDFDGERTSWQEAREAMEAKLESASERAEAAEARAKELDSNLEALREEDAGMMMITK